MNILYITRLFKVFISCSFGKKDPQIQFSERLFKFNWKILIVSIKLNKQIENSIRGIYFFSEVLN